MFESNYARIEYIEKDNVVLHTWKKEAHYEMYRASVIASLHLLQSHKGSYFVLPVNKGHIIR